MPTATLPAHLSDILNLRAGGSPSATQLWTTAISHLHASKLASEKETLFAKEARLPRHLEDLAAFLGKGERTNAKADQLIHCADESIHPLADWLEALSVFRHWLRRSGRHTQIESALGYLECCDASVDSAPGLTDLPATVQTMLETYGYDG
jgi:hypothetical protein